MPELKCVDIETVPDETPDPSYLEAESYAERRAEFERGEFTYVGIRATAELIAGDSQIITLTSPGLWGIESDSDESYLHEVGVEEKRQLRELLEEFGVGQDELDAHFGRGDEPILNVDGDVTCPNCGSTDFHEVDLVTEVFATRMVHRAGVVVAIVDEDSGRIIGDAREPQGFACRSCVTTITVEHRETEADQD